jgi:hypothetical protein
MEANPPGVGGSEESPYVLERAADRDVGWEAGD